MPRLASAWQPKNSICALVRLRYNNRKIALNFRPSRGSRRSSFAEEASFITNLCKRMDAAVISATLTFQINQFQDQEESKSRKSGFKTHQSLQCQQCPKSFDKKRGLYEHVMRNHSNIKHHCEKCGRQFKRRDHLKLHQKRFQNLKMCKTKK